MISRSLFAACLVIELACAAACLGELRAVDLRCEYLKDPMGIDVKRPRLSWRLTASERGEKQTAYKIFATGTADGFQKEELIWVSGIVRSHENHTEFLGGLESGVTVYWKVRVWDEHDKSTDSPTARFEMAFLHPSDWRARWICDSKPPASQRADMFADRPAPVFQQAITVDSSPQKTRAYVSGLGYYELYINGRRVGENLLDPAWTTYEKRTLYTTYDVNDFLRPGINYIAIIAGNGWFNPLPLRMWGSIPIRDSLEVGQPRVICQIEELSPRRRVLAATDPSWAVGDSPLLRNSVYLGELSHGPFEFSESGKLLNQNQRAAKPTYVETASLRAQMTNLIRVAEKIKPVAITEPKPGVFIFDMGRNLGGWAKLHVRNSKGNERVQMRYGELLYPDGQLNVMTSVCGQIKKAGMGGPGAPDVALQLDSYICRGAEDEYYTPRFTFHGFRYVEVTGYPGRPELDAIEGQVLHSDVESAGSFSCSNEMFNQIQEMVRRTYLSNLFGVQSDCPAREKFGYGGDIIVTSEMAMLNFDLSAFYAKVVNDFGDAARENGGITETAPFVGIADEGYGGGAGPIGWGTVHPVLLWQRYQYYGDKRQMAEQYDIAEKWVAYLDKHAEREFITRDIGDHETLAPKDVPLTSTAFYWLNHDLMSRIAKVLGKDDDAQRHAKRAAAIKDAFNGRFLDRATGRYGKATQACQAFALHFGLVPDDMREKALKVLVDDIAAHKNHLTTGIFGTKYMLSALSDAGRADLAYAIANQKDFPSWGNMLAGGATTLWEHWEFSDDTYSHNHPMFGSVSEWFIKYLGGIRPADDAVGFDHVMISPAFVPDLSWVKSRYESIRGTIVSEWRREGDSVLFHVTTPPNVTAVIHLPARDTSEVTEHGKPIDSVPGVETGSRDGHPMLTIQPGDYQFSLKALK